MQFVYPMLKTKLNKNNNAISDSFIKFHIILVFFPPLGDHAISTVYKTGNMILVKIICKYNTHVFYKENRFK